MFYSTAIDGETHFCKITVTIVCVCVLFLGGFVVRAFATITEGLWVMWGITGYTE